MRTALLSFPAVVFAADDPTMAVLEWVRTGGAVGILAAAVVAFLRGWIVSGSQYRQAVADRDKALELVYKQAEIAQRALDAAERK